jgi:D-alanine--poly(phosphoribitol) ligase subunit 1
MSPTSSQQDLLTRMHEVVTRRAAKVAVRDSARSISYAEFGDLIAYLHAEIDESDPASISPVGLLLERSALAYAAMWAAIGLGRAYVPLNTTYPGSRLGNIVELAGVGTVVCTAKTRELALSLGIAESKLVVASEEPPRRAMAAAQQTWWTARSGDDIAYVLFTSGSTGQPKGVPISYDNLRAFIDNMGAAIEYDEDDVCSQVCELSFDFSVQEIYLALLHGCTLCPARGIDLFNPAHYIRSRSITVWISVPSLARVMFRNDVATGDALHGVRISIFNGEALTAGLAAAWHEAAPNSQIWNSYGPTECTVAVTTQRWSSDPELRESDVIAIGKPFPDCHTALLSESVIVSTDAATQIREGELLLSTPQRFAGYSDPALASPFITDDSGTIWYRTGDRVLVRGGRLFHMGRVDHQVKIGGHRIELLEIEHRIRRWLGTDALAVIAFPARHPRELVLFLKSPIQSGKLSADCLGLPAYMLPGRTRVVESLPTNPHGKLDRAALQSLAETDQ